MTPDYYLCDVCKAPTKHRFFFCTGSKFDGAGSRDDGESVDLCDAHMARLIVVLTKNIEAAALAISTVERFKKMPPER